MESPHNMSTGNYISGFQRIPVLIGREKKGCGCYSRSGHL